MHFITYASAIALTSCVVSLPNPVFSCFGCGKVANEFTDFKALEHGLDFKHTYFTPLKDGSGRVAVRKAVEVETEVKPLPVQPVAAMEATGSTSSLSRSSSIESIHPPPTEKKGEPQMITTFKNGVPVERHLQFLGPDGKVKAGIVDWESKGPSDSPF